MPRAIAQRGFTALELLLAAALVCVGVGGLVAVHAAQVRAEKAGRVAIEAAAVADDFLEEALAARGAPADQEAAPVVRAGVSFRRVLYVSPVGGAPTLWKLRAEVSWEGGT